MHSSRTLPYAAAAVLRGGVSAQVGMSTREGGVSAQGVVCLWVSGRGCLSGGRLLKGVAEGDNSFQPFCFL